VRKALMSSERVEVLAAVAALDRLTAASPRLAHGVLPTVLELLQGMSLPLDAKCRLAGVLGHMRHTPELAHAAHQGGTKLLRLYVPCRGPNPPCSVSAFAFCGMEGGSALSGRTSRELRRETC
jgi:hypothetical protein